MFSIFLSSEFVNEQSQTKLFILTNNYINLIWLIITSVKFDMIARAFYKIPRMQRPVYSFGNQSISEQLRKMRQASPSPLYNITPRIIQLSERKLLQIPNHPLSIMKQKIVQFFGPSFDVSSNLNPIVDVYNNFDVLNIEKDHVSRKPTDTFYINEQTLLRTHTSAHQRQKLTSGLKRFLVFGDVYRRDEIDRYHYPVFHQMEGVSMLGNKQNVTVDDVVEDLKKKHEQLAKFLFGECEMRWVQGYFPFTYPSFQLQVYFDGKWVQMMGCGVIHDGVLQRSGRSKERGWASGLGLERFAMRLFKIPDVRLFWSQDKRFLNQFQSGKITQFQQFSKYPTCFKDISMWVKQDFNPNDLFGIIRQIGGDLIEQVIQTDTYFNKKNNKTSKTYRICFRSLERTLVNEQITKYQFAIRDAIVDQLPSAELR